MKEISVSAFGWTSPERSGDVPTAKIRLNAGLCLLRAKSLNDAKGEPFVTLLHEMIHGKSPLLFYS
jgi:hypothetical protein